MRQPSRERSTTATAMRSYAPSSRLLCSPAPGGRMLRRRERSGNGVIPRGPAGQSSGGRSLRSSSASPRAASRDHPGDERCESYGVEGLQHVSERAELLSTPLSFVVARAVRKTMGMSRVPSSGRELLGDRPPVHVRHHQVEQDEVRRLRAGERQRLLAVVGLQDLDPGQPRGSPGRAAGSAARRRRRARAPRGLVCLGFRAQVLRSESAECRAAITRGSRSLRRVFAAGGRTRVASRGEPARSSCA